MSGTDAIKADEVALWREVVTGSAPRDAGKRLGIPAMRVITLCEKWGRQGKYQWGVSADLGWPVDPSGARY